MAEAAIPAGALAEALAHALEHEHLRVYYQPIVALDDRSIVAVEALTRWEHPRWGPISPATFVPVAERSGLIVTLDRWVLETACRQVKGWQCRFPMRPPLVANVNLSARLVQQPTLVDDVRQTLRRSGLAPQYLRLEITESVLMQDSVSNLRTLHALRLMGIAIAIDDFGTGYSSLSYLRWLPADVLKLDRSFVARLGQDHRDTVIIQGLIGIAKGLGMSLTAEGIETEEQCAHLQDLGCDHGQGYLFAPPLPADSLTNLLQREQLTIAAAAATGGRTGSVWSRGEPHRPRVLVVDDDDQIRRLTRNILELDGYEVVTAAHGTAALDRIKQQPPDVILLDMMMPGMDGWHFSRAYHEQPGPHVPIIVLTAADNAARCAAEIGATGYLGKPFAVDDLLTSVDHLVAEHTR